VIDVGLSMTKTLSRLPGFTRGGFSPRGLSTGSAESVRARVLLLLLRPISLPPTWGVGIAAVMLAAESLTVLVLARVAPGNLFGVIFVLGVLVISLGWGFGLGTLTALASALIYAYFHDRQAGGRLAPFDLQQWVAIIVFLVIALSATALGGVARLRAVAADERRREAEASHAELGVLAGHQAALRRVATLVARGVDPSELFDAVAQELALCLGAHHDAVLFRYESNSTGTLIAASHMDPGLTNIPVGERFSLDGENVVARVFDTRRAARIDSYDDASGAVATRFRALGLRTAVGAPIIVDGRLWGAAIVGSSRPEPLPSDTEVRLADFTDLVATAIANADAHSELTASRVRIVAAADDARRRIERDLHDGAQQRLVSLGLELRTAEMAIPPELDAVKNQMSGYVTTVGEILAELQELSRGIHPAMLSRGGLDPALKALARRSAVPVELVLAVNRRLQESTEVAAYYVVAEALTNAAKHARAAVVEVCVDTEGPDLHLLIRDNGIGGANTADGSGLVGLKDRVHALGGRLAISSPPGEGTCLEANIPVS
jgi:signal transduction histidine kinase